MGFDQFEPGSDLRSSDQIKKDSELRGSLVGWSWKDPKGKLGNGVFSTLERAVADCSLVHDMLNGVNSLVPTSWDELRLKGYSLVLAELRELEGDPYYSHICGNPSDSCDMGCMERAYDAKEEKK